MRLVCIEKCYYGRLFDANDIVDDAELESIKNPAFPAVKDGKAPDHFITEDEYRKRKREEAKKKAAVGAA